MIKKNSLSTTKRKIKNNSPAASGPRKALTISGAINSALPTGVSSRGVARGEVTLVLNFIPEPRSKSHNLTGDNWSGWTQRMFSGFRSL